MRTSPTFRVVGLGVVDTFLEVTKYLAENEALISDNISPSLVRSDRASAIRIRPTDQSNNGKENIPLIDQIISARAVESVSLKVCSLAQHNKHTSLQGTCPACNEFRDCSIAGSKFGLDTAGSYSKMVMLAYRLRHSNNTPVNGWLYCRRTCGRILDCESGYLRNVAVVKLIEAPSFDHRYR